MQLEELFGRALGVESGTNVPAIRGHDESTFKEFGALATWLARFSDSGDHKGAVTDESVGAVVHFENDGPFQVENKRQHTTATTSPKSYIPKPAKRDNPVRGPKRSSF